MCQPLQDYYRCCANARRRVGRELQVLHLLDTGLTNKEIAHAMVVTPGTVKVHTNNLYRKLIVDNRRAAVSLAKALGLLAVEQAPKLQ